MNYPGFCSGTFESIVSNVENELTVNLIVSDMESEGATARRVMYRIPGVDSISTHTGGAGRAHYFLNGREFAVLGTDFIEIDQPGNMTVRGTVATDTNPACIVGNGESGGQILITSGGSAYVFTLATNAFAAVSGPPWAAATMCDMVDGYGLIFDATTSKFYVSDLLDFSTWDAGQFAARSLAPDQWVSMKVLGRFIWLTGESTTEAWYNSGAASSFPFAPYLAIGVVANGCAAPFSPAVAGPALCWLEQKATGGYSVVATFGGQPEAISSKAFEEELSTYDVVDDAIGFAFTTRGHTLYCLTFPFEDVTWAYDFTSKAWIQLAAWISEENRFAAWRAIYPVFAYGQQRVLDRDGSTLWVFTYDPTKTDIEGRPIRWLRRAPILELENKRVYYSYVELDLAVGLADQDEDPQVMMRYSNDGGRNWSNELMRSAGLTGEYGRRVRWNRCGMGRRRVFEFSGSDAYTWQINNAYLELTGDNVSGARR